MQPPKHLPVFAHGYTAVDPAELTLVPAGRRMPFASHLRHMGNVDFVLRMEDDAEQVVLFACLHRRVEVCGNAFDDHLILNRKLV